jgi:hypothetical protein
MALLQVEVADLIASELWSKNSACALPLLPVCGEYPMTKSANAISDMQIPEVGQ